MNCDEVKLELALWVGNDLDDRARIEELRRHVATCPECRVRAKSLQSSMVVLGATAPDPTYDRPESLWPELQARIEYLEKTPKNPPPYGKWAIGLVTAGVMTAGVWAWVNRPAPPTEPPMTVTVPPPAPSPPPSYSHPAHSGSSPPSPHGP